MPKVIAWSYQIRAYETLRGWFGYPNLNAVGLSYQKIFKVHYEPVPVEETVKGLREANMMSCLAAVDNETIHGVSTPPEWVAEQVQKYPDAFIGFAGADPHKGYAAAKKLEKDVKQYGFKGVYVQPMVTGVNIDDRRHYPIYTKACELGIPIYVACSVHYNLAVPMDVQTPYQVDHVAVDFPELKIVLRHALFPWIWEIAAVMMRHENVYVDISAFRHKNIHPEWMKVMDGQFKKRTVYGIGYIGLTPKQNVEEFMTLPLKEDAKSNILYKTSAEILGIPND